MPDFNSINSDNANKQINKQINELIDQALVKQRKSDAVRNYLGASRLGVSCSRSLQYEYQNVKKDGGRDFNGQTLRVFAAGHLFEDMAIGWLRDAGFTLLTEDRDGKQFGFSVADGKIAGHVDGIITGSPDAGTAGTDKSGTDKSGTDKSDGLKMPLPALWEMKSMNNRSWNDTVKKGLILNPIANKTDKR